MRLTKPKIEEGILYLEDVLAIVDAIPTPGPSILVTAGNVWHTLPGSPGIIMGWTQNGISGINRSTFQLGFGQAYVTTIQNGRLYIARDVLENVVNDMGAVPAQRTIKMVRQGGSLVLVTADCDPLTKPPLLPSDPPDPPPSGGSPTANPPVTSFESYSFESKGFES